MSGTEPGNVGLGNRHSEYMHEFWSRSEVHEKLTAICQTDLSNKYITATRALVGGVLRLLEISTACVAQSLELRDYVTDIRIYSLLLIGFTGPWKINCCVSTWLHE